MNIGCLIFIVALVLTMATGGSALIPICIGIIVFFAFVGGDTNEK